MLFALSWWVPNFATHLGMLKPSKMDQIQWLSSQVCVVCWCFLSKIIEEAWLHIAHSMTVVSFYRLAIWHAFGIRLQRRKLEEQPHVGLGLVDAATLIELWIESLKTYWRLTSSTILLFYKLIFPIHRPTSAPLWYLQTLLHPSILHHSPSFQSWAPSNFVATHLQPSFVELLKEHLTRKKKNTLLS